MSKKTLEIKQNWTKLAFTFRNIIFCEIFRFTVELNYKFLGQLNWNFSISEKNPSKLWCLFLKFSLFGPLLVGKWAWPPHAPLMSWGFQTWPKSRPTFWANQYFEIMFSKFSGYNDWTVRYCSKIDAIIL